MFSSIFTTIQVIIQRDFAIEQIKLAKELGIKAIVTEHHDIPFKEDSNGTREFIIPPADAVINPKQEECKYPCKSLC